KRDCQTCHMQQNYGHPGTAQALYKDGKPIPALSGQPANDGPERQPYFAHHFIGGNSYSTRLVGADVDEFGTPEAYPQLSTFSFSSADPKSVYNNAYWTNVKARGPATQHARLAWDRLRNVLDLSLTGPTVAPAGSRAPLRVVVTNSGSGHKFPSGFPEGRVAWLAVHAFDLDSGAELPIYDAKWQRTSLGVGYMTPTAMKDPRFPHCDEELPAGSPDPYALQFKATASLGDGCPTLDLPYATPLNLVVDKNGVPIDKDGKVIDASNPRALPIFRDVNGNGDHFDDSYLSDTRLQPLPHPGATADLDRYSVVLPPGIRGPVAVSAAVYYQSFEAVVAKKFLGNLADTNTNFTLETCVLRGACDGRTPVVEPAVVEGSPPVPMESRSWVIDVRGTAVDTAPPAVRTYPADGATGTYRDVVVKAFFSEPIAGLDDSRFTLTDEKGAIVPAFVDQIGDGTWGLFPHQVFLEPGRTYTAHLAAGVCDFRRRGCTNREVSWRFKIAAKDEDALGDTSVPLGFPARRGPGQAQPTVVAVTSTPPAGAAGAGGAGVTIAFSEAVMNVNSSTVHLTEQTGSDCSAKGTPIAGRLSANAGGDRWTYRPAKPLAQGRRYCLDVSTEVYDLKGKGLERPYRTSVK
ncbi:MAG TPA: Ig-like domain-containing protein, partial [Thermoanaerobaculia bacterium]